MFKKISGTFAGKLTLAVLNFLMIIITTRILGAEGRGEISLFATNMAIIKLFVGIIGGASLVYLAPRYPRIPLMITAYSWNFTVTLAACSIFYYTKLVEGIDTSLYLFACTFVFSLFDINTMLLLSKEKINAFNISVVLQAGLHLGFFLLMFYSSEIDANAFYLSLFVAVFICWGYSLNVFIKGEDFSVIIPDLTIVKTMFNYGFLSQLSNIIQFLNYRLSYYFLESNLGTKELGIYSVAVSISESVWLLSNSVATIQYSKIANMNNRFSIRKITIRLFKLNFILNIVAILFLISIPAVFYQYLFGGEEFMDVRNIIVALAFGTFILGGVATPISPSFSGRGIYHPMIVSSFLGAIISVVGCYYLIPIYGVYGAAITTCISYTILAFYLYIAFVISEKIQLFSLFPTLSDFKVVANLINNKQRY